MKRMSYLMMVALLGSVGTLFAADRNAPLVVTASNGPQNQLLVFDAAGQLLQSVATLGQGGAGNNAGGIATFGFTLRDLLPVASSPLSVAFGKDHLYVLGTATVESHALSADAIDDRAVAAQTVGTPSDIAAEGGLLALIEGNGGGTAHVTLFRITADGDLEQTASTAIASPANGIAIVTGR